MTAVQHGLCQLTDQATATADAEAALRLLRKLRAELEEYERERVREALAAGRSFGAVARALGISRQAAHRRYRDEAPPPKLALSSQARRAVQLAREETGSHIGSEHVLLGVLRSGGSTASALEALGVTEEAARACARSDGAPAGRGSAQAVRAVLAEAAKIAGARGAATVDPEHLMLGALSDPEGGATQILIALGVTPATIRERLGC